MSNPFQNRTPPLGGPATDIFPVVPNDGADLPDTAVALYIQTGGALSIVTVRGNTRTVSVADHSILPVGVRRVRATGTTATGIHAFLLA
ncbi:MAG TPA: hypothetical protein PKD10_18905 [Paracoccaceae bacterium]|nr:hypothetical protein [Paracoccaceae bacterium]